MALGNGKKRKPTQDNKSITISKLWGYNKVLEAEGDWSFWNEFSFYIMNEALDWEIYKEKRKSQEARKCSQHLYCPVHFRHMDPLAVQGLESPSGPLHRLFPLLELIMPTNNLHWLLLLSLVCVHMSPCPGLFITFNSSSCLTFIARAVTRVFRTHARVCIFRVCPPIRPTSWKISLWRPLFLSAPVRTLCVPQEVLNKYFSGVCAT